MKQILTFILCAFICAIANAQIDENVFKNLQLNSSPAYVILGVEPDNIQRPNSPNDFVASAQSAVVNGKLQPNFAMETSPYYWGKKKPEDITSRYSPLYFLTSHNYWDNLAKSLTFSFATSPSDSFTFGNIPVGTGLGLGFHLQLVQGNVSRKTAKNLFALFKDTRLQHVLVDIDNAFDIPGTQSIDLDGIIDAYFSTNRATLTTSPVQELKIKEAVINIFHKHILKLSERYLVTDAIKDVDKASKGLVTNLTKVALTREGFMVELAFADAIIAEQSRYDQFTNAKAAIWVTPSYRFNTAKDPDVIDYIDVMAVSRMTFNSKYVDSSHYFDAGLKLQWTHNNLSLSGESIFRLLNQKPEMQTQNYTWRNDFSLSYKISDAVTFKATFGSNFDGNSTHYSDPKKLFAVGGFNFGFSNFSKKTN